MYHFAENSEMHLLRAPSNSFTSHDQCLDQTIIKASCRKVLDGRTPNRRLTYSLSIGA